ncbi:MAG: NAD(P)H-dependent oxidoreductase [Coriobacteriales bacterium]|nr:NAD(P)H-dependent oxidoreductase [Coriobacteriales bacterium]
MKTLVIYFSLTGNTKKVAKKIAELSNADILEIEPKQKYSKKYLPTFFACLKEGITHARPAFKTKIPSLKKYDLVLVGGPIWGGNLPCIIYSFLDQCNLDKKKIALFSTSDKIGPQKAAKKCKKIYKNTIWCHALNANNVKSKDLKNWLKSL